MSEYAPDPGDDSTLTPVRRGSRPGWALWLRRATIASLVVVLASAAAGLLGVRSATTSSSAEGYTLTVTYARVARAGLDVPLRVVVSAPEVFPTGSQVTLRISREYLTIFEMQGLWPESSAETGDATNVSWEFDTPSDSHTFAVDYDAYIQPAAQRGADCMLSLEIDGAELTSVRFTTSLLP